MYRQMKLTKGTFNVSPTIHDQLGSKAHSPTKASNFSPVDLLTIKKEPFNFPSLFFILAMLVY
jgi:hypothetical protein